MANVELNLNNTSMEHSFGFRPRDILQQANQNVTGLMRLNNRIHPATCRAVADTGLFLITLLHFHADLFQLYVRSLPVTSVPCVCDYPKRSSSRLGCSHYGVARSVPGKHKPRI